LKEKILWGIVTEKENVSEAFHVLVHVMLRNRTQLQATCITERFFLSLSLVPLFANTKTISLISYVFSFYFSISFIDCFFPFLFALFQLEVFIWSSYLFTVDHYLIIIYFSLYNSLSFIFSISLISSISLSIRIAF
jgi:hypothetical protein